jgi:hypothetical protein
MKEPQAQVKTTNVGGEDWLRDYANGRRMEGYWQEGWSGEWDEKVLCTEYE